MNRYKQSLFDLIYKYVGEYHKAEDILQQVWLKLYLSLAVLHPNACIKLWLFTVARNHHCSDFEPRNSDARTHFETLTYTPEDLLRHISSPFAPEKRSTQSQERAA